MSTCPNCDLPLRDSIILKICWGYLGRDTWGRRRYIVWDYLWEPSDGDINVSRKEFVTLQRLAPLLGYDMREEAISEHV